MNITSSYNKKINNISSLFLQHDTLNYNFAKHFFIYLHEKLFDSIPLFSLSFSTHMSLKLSPSSSSFSQVNLSTFHREWRNDWCGYMICCWSHWHCYYGLLPPLLVLEKSRNSLIECLYIFFVSLLCLCLGVGSNFIYTIMYYFSFNRK